jgi:hypothetical protein
MNYITNLNNSKFICFSFWVPFQTVLASISQQSGQHVSEDNEKINPSVQSWKKKLWQSFLAEDKPVREGNPRDLTVDLLSQLKKSSPPKHIPWILFTLKVRLGDLQILPKTFSTIFWDYSQKWWCLSSAFLKTSKSWTLL